jgi:[ribosomal protein S5]-alanine N-acetyltransferase
LVIREFQSSDWRAVHAYASDPETTRFMDWGPNVESDSRDFVRRAKAYRTTKPRTHYDLAITVKRTRELIGGCGIEVTHSDRKEGEIGYTLDKAYWGKGYGTETAQALLTFGFTRLALHRISGRCDPSNIGSIRVLEKVGMTLEGHLREDFLVRGEWRDTMIYGILQREWASRRRARS